MLFVWWLWVLHFAVLLAATRVRAVPSQGDCRLSARLSDLCDGLKSPDLPCKSRHVTVGSCCVSNETLPRYHVEPAQQKLHFAGVSGFAPKKRSRPQVSTKQPRGRLPLRRLPIWRQMTHFPPQILEARQNRRLLVAVAYLTRAQVRCPLHSITLLRRARKPLCDSSWQQ